MNKLYITFILVFLLTTSGCTIRYYDTNKLLNDYTTEGFLDTDHYQVIIKGTVNNEARGLVARRESALEFAKAVMQVRILESLVDYNINYHLKKSGIDNVNSVQNMDGARNEVSKELEYLLKFGTVAFEYYNDDDSAVIVYRLFKDDLISRIESVKPEFSLNEK